MGSCAAPSAKGDDKFITTDYLQQCRHQDLFILRSDLPSQVFIRRKVRRVMLPTY
ncbi:hypothetical protein CSC09_5164 (plasmid) [Escherichia coli]|uniref:hypothetical protein n=1 Tax=Escherichia coli TaxID=562 RepID=UPI000B31833B|nr:hypothetical protein [Escherichia coli]AVJ68409.1 hypothetical protein CSC09_5164 [Escherichia coli]